MIQTISSGGGTINTKIQNIGHSPIVIVLALASCHLIIVSTISGIVCDLGSLLGGRLPETQDSVIIGSRDPRILGAQDPRTKDLSNPGSSEHVIFSLRTAWWNLPHLSHNVRELCDSKRENSSEP